MDGSRFDALTRTMVGATSRRGLFGRAAALAVAGLGVRPTAAQDDPDRCARFCRLLPPGRQRGQCVADCTHGVGLFEECGGDPDRLCLEAGMATCCPSGQPCQNGSCGCPEHYAYCQQSRTCIFDNCHFNQQGRLIFNPQTCQCDCRPAFMRLTCGVCAVPCGPDQPCAEGTCVQSPDGQSACAVGSWSASCGTEEAPCETTDDCCPCGQNNICAPNGRCYGTV
jgi:hypothetical protein